MKVLIADKFESFGIDQLKSLGCDVVNAPGKPPPELLAAAREHNPDVLIVRSTRVQRPLIEAMPNLSLVIRAGAGVDTIDVAAATERDVRVCNCPGKNSVAVAELTLGLMIALDRRIVDETIDLRHRIWKKKEYSKARGLKGRTLGIVGLGRIGQEVAKRAAAFEMTLLYYDPIPRSEFADPLGMRSVDLDVLLREGDFVSLHVPGGKNTRHLIDADKLALMKPTAFLINCSRGGIVDEEALGRRIASGHLGGAALDVYEEEPEGTEGEFRDPIVGVPRVYGTHHVGASTEQAQCAIAEETVRIVRTMLENGCYLNCVNPAELVAGV